MSVTWLVLNAPCDVPLLLDTRDLCVTSDLTYLTNRSDQLLSKRYIYLIFNESIYPAVCLDVVRYSGASRSECSDTYSEEVSDQQPFSSRKSDSPHRLCHTLQLSLIAVHLVDIW